MLRAAFRSPSERIALSRSIPVLIVSILLSAVPLQGADLPDDAWPEAWFHPPQRASEAGVTRFTEAPMLATRVAAGVLPPLEQRLPDDPYIIVPAHEIGRHGGTLRCFNADGSVVRSLEPPLIMDPQVSGILPNLAESWRYSKGGKVLELQLRPGLKWSDGHPFTSTAFLFWFEHILSHDELTPAMNPRWIGAQVAAPTPETVRFDFAEPHPFFVNELAHHGNSFYAPGHFLKDFHPTFIDPEELDAEVEREGFISWMAYFNAVRGNGMADPSGTPTMDAYYMVRKSPTMHVYERNPYYPKIDPAGNQLPYVDSIRVMQVTNAEVIAARTSTGQVHFSGNGIETQDIPLFKLGEKPNNYRTHIWNRLHGVDVVIQPNLTSADLELRAIFRDFRFRRALSLAINREEINTVVYFGRATPRQVHVIPSSIFYEKAYARAHTEYDPVTANRLLDDIGLVDSDGDGIREKPSGEPLSLTLEWVDIETPKGITMELVTEYWRAIGIQLSIKQVTASLQGTRARGNMMEMTLWHADRTSDILFPSEPFWFVPMHSGWEECHWVQWSDWYLSEGKRGEEPPPKIMQLIDWWVEMTTTLDMDRRLWLGKQILRSQAENLWTIGTLGLAPQPVVVHNSLHNVPERGYWGWDNRWSLPYHPETWYLNR
jgi:peptide/nickel transport system substrate-binding protein